MSIKTYSVKADGEKNLSKNFKAREFACKSGADVFKVDSRLVSLLQKIRDKFGAAVIINSAYRTAAHNKKVKGAKNSYHLQGMAADIVIKGVSPKRVAQYAEAIGVKGIGWYEIQGFTHVDTRSTKYFWKDKSGNVRNTFSHCPYSEPTESLSINSKGNGVKWLQWHLNRLGYKHIEVDGSFGPQTKLAVKDFQTKMSLTSDGICGSQTRFALKIEVI